MNHEILLKNPATHSAYFAVPGELHQYNPKSRARQRKWGWPPSNSSTDKTTDVNCNSTVSPNPRWFLRLLDIEASMSCWSLPSGISQIGRTSMSWSVYCLVITRVTLMKTLGALLSLKVYYRWIIGSSWTPVRQESDGNSSEMEHVSMLLWDSAPPAKLLGISGIIPVAL